MNMFKKIFTGLVFSSLCITFTSSATPITAWDYVVDTAFTTYDPLVGVTASDDNGYWTSPTLLEWGTPNTPSGQSSLQISSGSNGHLEDTGLANGSLELISTLTHNNFVISGPIEQDLDGAVLSTRLLLDPNPNDGIYDIMPLPLEFNINFYETLNSGTCSSPSPTPCNDIFVIDPGIAFNPITGGFIQQFDLDGWTYNIELLVSGLGALPTAACLEATGSSDDCIGFSTIENQTNSFDVSMRITVVPEPSVIFLMALALFGIAARSKRV